VSSFLTANQHNIGNSVPSILYTNSRNV